MINIQELRKTIKRHDTLKNFISRIDIQSEKNRSTQHHPPKYIPPYEGPANEKGTEKSWNN